MKAGTFAVIKKALQNHCMCLASFPVLQATESWAGPGNEASMHPQIELD